MSVGADISPALALLHLAAGKLQAASEQALSHGGSFNIFRVLGIGHREVITHSPMLVELLNPKGSHGQGTAFLERFLCEVGVCGFRLDSGSIRVSPEMHLGPVTETSGGRLDIVVGDGYGCTLFIENKIHAGEQKNQLARYHAHDPRAQLIFLTLHGSRPLSAPSGVHVNCISYKQHISRWLEACEAAVVHIPRLCELLRQYRELIHHLQQPHSHSSMSTSLAEHILQDAQSHAAYRALLATKSAVRHLVFQRWNERMTELGLELGLQLAEAMKGEGYRYDGWSFTSEALTAVNLKIGFQADSNWGQHFSFGFKAHDHTKECPIQEALSIAFNSRFRAQASTNYWPAWTWWEAHKQLDEAHFGDLLFGSIADEVRTVTSSLLETFHSAR